MKLLGTELAYLLRETESRRNLAAFARVLVVLCVLIAIDAVLFHVIMLYEGQTYSWFTGVYWTLTVMSTLGFGDITFHTDLGRLFSMVVLLTGIVMMLIVLPFAFIRFFYAPWLEAQIRTAAPRKVDPDVSGHVVLCHHDKLTDALLERLGLLGIPYYVIEPDPSVAADLAAAKMRVFTGDLDSRATYEALHVERACMVVANLDDATNTNITLTVREVTAETPVVAFVESRHSVDVLELSGATHVLDLKHQLGVHLANRVGAGLHVVGRHRELCIAEFSIYGTPFEGQTVRQSELREQTGAHLVGIWERAAVQAVGPDTVLQGHAAAIVVGGAREIDTLATMLRGSRATTGPVIVIGGGNVGKATVRAVKERGHQVHVIDVDEGEREALSELADRVFVGDAADLDVVVEAGIHSAESVVLTTNNDAINIYLTVYCRKLNPDVLIVTRVTHPRNLEAIHRAGSDFVLSYGALEVEALIAIAKGRELVVLGEDIELFVVPTPLDLVGMTLADARIGAETGLSVLAVQVDDEPLVVASSRTELSDGSELVMIGSAEQRARYARRYS